MKMESPDFDHGRIHYWKSGTEKVKSLRIVELKRSFYFIRIKNWSIGTSICMKDINTVLYTYIYI